MEIFKYHHVSDEKLLSEFFQKPKELQRYAFVSGHMSIPESIYTDVVVTDEYAVIERGIITPTRGLRGIFPKRTGTFRWYYSAKTKKVKSISWGDKYCVGSILSCTKPYAFVEHVPVDMLSGSIVRDILYGKLTNPHDVQIAYGKRLGVKNINKYMYKLAARLNASPILILAVINPAQLETCYDELINRFDSYDGGAGLQRIFRDMLGQAYALGEHINLKWSTNRMNEEHTNWTRKLMQMDLDTKSGDPVWGDDVRKAFAEEGFELLDTEKRVFEEGTLMGHCLYTNYWRRIASKDYLALHIDLNVGPATVGMRRKKRGDNTSRFTLEQAHHKYNRQLSVEDMKVVERKLIYVSGLLDSMVENV